MADERLRLIAELKDNASKQLQILNKEMKSIKLSPGMEQTNKWFRNFSEQARGFVKDGGGISGAMSSIGIGSITAAASLTELTRQFKELADKTIGMRELGRETGLSVDQLRQLNATAEHFSYDKMSGAVQHLTDAMPEFRRGFGELHDQLAGRWPDLVNKLRTEDTASQLKDIAKFMGEIKNPGDQRNFAELFFGDKDAARLFSEGSKGFLDEWAHFAQTMPRVTSDMMKQAQALHDSVNEFTTSWENFETTVAPTVFKGLTIATEDFETAFKTIQDATSWLNHPNAVATKKLEGDAAGTDAAHYGREVGAWLHNWLLGSKPASPFGTLDPNTKFKPAITLDPKTTDGLRKKTSFDPSQGGLLQLMDYRLGGSNNPIRIGVREGTLDAFRAWKAEADNDKPSADGDGGMRPTNASYETGGGSRAAQQSFHALGRSLQAHGGGGGGGDYGHFSGSGDDVKGSDHTKALYAMNRLIKDGFSPASAAIFAGGDMQESSLNPNASGDPSVPGGSHGLGQWNRERLARLKAFAGDKWKSMNAQLDFQAQEVLKSHPEWAHQHDLSRGPGIEKSYEGYRKGFAGKRSLYASQFYRDLQAHHEEAAKNGKGLPPGAAYWGKDAEGNPVAVGHDGRSLASDGNAVPYRRSLGAGGPPQTVHHTGGAVVEIRGLPASQGTHVRTHGLIQAVNLTRWPTMTTPDDAA